MASNLQDAILTDDIEMLNYLISTGISINRPLPDGRAPLNTAIATGNDVIISLLMATNPNLEVQDSFRVEPGARLQPIHYASIHNHPELVVHLLSQGISVDHPDDGNCTPLHHAAHHGHLDLVLYLLKEGADINWTSDSGRTPLWKATHNGHRDLVQLLIAKGADVNTANRIGETALFACISKDCLLPIAEDLIVSGADVNIADLAGNTALHKAASLGRTKACKLLIGAGADVTAVTEFNHNTPVHSACIQDQVSTAAILLNHCISTPGLNMAGQSPLYLAMLHQQTSTTRLLHNLGVRLTPQEHKNFTNYEAYKNSKKLAFWRWCSEFFGTPKTLGSLCRAVVRNAVNNAGQTVEKASPQLPLPRSLQSVILLDDYITDSISHTCTWM